MSEVIERPVTTRPSMTPDTMIEKYVKLRDRKNELEEKHKQELAPFKQLMDELEGWLLEALNAADLQSMRSPHGTAYKSIRTSATVRERQAFLDYVIANQAWDLIESRCNKTTAFGIIEETKQPIPGVDTTSEVVVNVRRASSSASK